MIPLISHFQDYVSQVTGARVSAQRMERARLPQYLTQQYELHQLRVDGSGFLGIVLREPETFQPSRFEKHLGRLMEAQEGESNADDYCLIAEELPGYVRRSLVKRRIPFVVPGLQLNWPALGAVVQSRNRHARKVAKTEPRLLMPATQVVILYALNGGMDAAQTPKALAQRLGYTAMTLSRALDEIEAQGLGRVSREGRERLLDFPEGLKALWEKAESRLRNPVREMVRVWQHDLPTEGTFQAGETALAGYSLLAEPSEPVFAIGRDDWKLLARTVERVPIPESDTCHLQVWRYEPRLLARNGVVDPFSLYLSLKDEPDERVQIALEEMMEETWLEG